MTVQLRALLVLGLASLPACGDRPERDCGDGVDNDEDGWRDCFDQDCEATCGEVCGNLLDDNRDGATDCDDPLCEASCASAPGDGPEACGNAADDDGDWLVDCQDPDCDGLCDADGDGVIGPDYGGPDCDDGRADVHPGVAEVPYDGADQDCDPLTPDDDLDGDGFPLAADCADEDAATFPDAPETCGDAVLNDCTSPVAPPRTYCYGERLAATADGVLVGGVGSGLAGFSVAAAGDANGDGFADIVVGSYGDGDDNTGAAYLVYGPLSGDHDLNLSAHKWLGESVDSWAGIAVAGGRDLTGDGAIDLVIGVRYDDQGGNNAGAALIVTAEGAGDVTPLADEPVKIVGSLQYDYAGSAVAIVGDVNADGFADALIGAPNYTNPSPATSSAGAAFVVFGPITGETQLSQVDYRVVGGGKDDNAGCAVGAPGDLDGDGQDDILVGICLADPGGLRDAGAAVQFSTHDAIERRAIEADGAMAGDAQNDHLGAAVAGGDLDDDGLADVVVAAPDSDANGEDAGLVYVAEGPATSAMFNPQVSLFGESAGDKAGTSVAVIGDVDGDGVSDLAVGAPYSDVGAQDAGATYVLFGPLAGNISLGDADVRIVGEASFDFFGQSVAGAGDVDNDGFDDVLVGAPYNDTADAAAGSAYVFTFDW